MVTRMASHQFCSIAYLFVPSATMNESLPPTHSMHIPFSLILKQWRIVISVTHYSYKMKLNDLCILNILIGEAWLKDGLFGWQSPRKTLHANC